MARAYFPLLSGIQDRSSQYFELVEHDNGPTPEESRRRTRIAHPEWIPAHLLAFRDDLNGSSLAWRSKDDGSGRPFCQGSYRLLGLRTIYRDWKDVVHVGTRQDPREDERLRHFKIVDFFVPEACVGLYHDEQQDPGLYFQELGEGTQPQPLHLDLNGYLALLDVSLGYQYWQTAVLDLLNGTTTAEAEQFKENMSAWVPGFSFKKFAALYEKVRLRG